MKYSILCSLSLLLFRGELFSEEEQLPIIPPSTVTEEVPIAESSKMEEESSPPPIAAVQPSAKRDYFIEVRASYYYPTKNLIRDIYGEGCLYGLEFDIQAWKSIYGWVGVSYLHEDGKTTRGNYSTSLTMVPVTFGLKYIYNHDRWRPYFGIGFETAYLRVKTNSPYMNSTGSKWGVGGVFKAGVLIKSSGHFIFDLFADYALMQASLDGSHRHFVIRRDLDVSGWALGAALGYAF